MRSTALSVGAVPTPRERLSTRLPSLANADNLRSMSALSKLLEGKVLVTRASGFIGGQLRDVLLERARTWFLVRPTSPAVRRGRGVALNYTDVAGLRELLERERPTMCSCTRQGHEGRDLASTSTRQRSAHRELDARAARRASGGEAIRPRVLADGLRAKPGSRPLRETDPREPVEHYGRSKLEAELAVEGLGDALPWTIIRPPAVYGPAEVDMFNLFKAAHSGVNLFFGNRTQRASAVDVDDLLDGMVLAAQAEAARGRAYFFTDGERTPGSRFSRISWRPCGKRTLTVSLPGFLVPGGGGRRRAPHGVRQEAALDEPAEGDPRCAERLGVLTRGRRATTLATALACRHGRGHRRTYRWYREHGYRRSRAP